MTQIAKVKQPHWWEKYPKAERSAKKMPKHFRGHKPPPQNRANLLDPKKYADFDPSTKCKLYILRRASPFNLDNSTEICHGTKLRNVNRTLSRCKRHEQAAAYVVVPVKSNIGSKGSKLIRIY